MAEVCVQIAETHYRIAKKGFRMDDIGKSKGKSD
jgi:hypothetical protein